LTSSSVNINGATITLNASHSLGVLAVICYSTDTLTIGTLNAGTYELTYHLYAPPTIYDIDTIIFTVQQASGLQLIENSDQKIKVYPNPATTEIHIDLNTPSTEKHDIDIYSVFGQKIKTIREVYGIITVDISDLIGEIYFIVITNGQNKRWTKKITKYTP
jgi:hypothetical protein